MGELGLCTISDVSKLVSVQVWADISTDTGWPMVIIRLLHNKVIYEIVYFLRCYSLYWDMAQAVQFLSPFLIPFVFACFFQKHSRRLAVGTLLFYPFFFLFNPLHLNLGQRILTYQVIFMGLATLGCTVCIRWILRRKRASFGKPVSEKYARQDAITPRKH